ncbi:MAG: hypothetical protein AAFN81_35300, partial [Bacteroidota bacterium]
MPFPPIHIPPPAPPVTQERRGTSIQHGISGKKRISTSPLEGTILLHGSAKRTHYTVLPPDGTDPVDLQQEVSSVCQKIDDCIVATESDGSVATAKLALHRFLTWNGTAYLESTIQGNRVARYLNALENISKDELKLSVATRRNVASALKLAFNALAQLPNAPSGLQTAICIAHSASKKARRRARRERAAKLTHEGSKGSLIDFNRLRNILHPHLIAMRSLKQQDWSKASGVIVSSLYLFGIAARPGALSDLKVEDGIQLASGSVVASGKLKNRATSVATTFKLCTSAARSGMREFCHGRDSHIPLFSRTPDCSGRSAKLKSGSY